VTPIKSFDYPLRPSNRAGLLTISNRAAPLRRRRRRRRLDSLTRTPTRTRLGRQSVSSDRLLVPVCTVSSRNVRWKRLFALHGKSDLFSNTFQRNKN